MYFKSTVINSFETLLHSKCYSWFFPGLDIDECGPSPCLNGGTCIDGINQFTCNCTEGWTADRCHIGEYDLSLLSPHHSIISVRHKACRIKFNFIKAYEKAKWVNFDFFPMYYIIRESAQSHDIPSLQMSANTSLLACNEDALINVCWFWYIIEQVCS